MPSSHEARYFACSSVRLSMSTPIVSSFRRAISSSISRGTGYTFRSSDAACCTAYSVERAWFAKDMSITLADGRRLYLVADGRLVNLSAAEGHPALVMDMSFANQALALEYAARHASELDRRVYPVPSEIDREIARLKLETMGVEIDRLTEEQARYLASWDEGT